MAGALRTSSLHRIKCPASAHNMPSFSADTMPTDSLVNEGMDSTLLIHEATMEDQDIELAAKKAHSTVGQALNIGQRYRLPAAPHSPHI